MTNIQKVTIHIILVILLNFKVRMSPSFHMHPFMELLFQFVVTFKIISNHFDFNMFTSTGSSTIFLYVYK